MSFYSSGRPTQFGELPAGPDGIATTLKLMGDYVKAWKKDPGINQLSTSLVRNLPQGDISAEVKALHAFVRDNIRYTNDTTGVETLRDPRATLEMGVGDCDDKATLLATLLESIGRKTRFVAMGFGPTRDYSHVLVEVRVGRGWFPLETIKPVAAGWSPNGVTHRMLYHN